MSGAPIVLTTDLVAEPEPEPERQPLTSVMDSPVSTLRQELNKVQINHEDVAELLPSLGGFLTANNPLLAAVEAVQNIAEAPAEPSHGLIHWLGEMASEAPAKAGAGEAGEGEGGEGAEGGGGGWFAGLGWAGRGQQPQEEPQSGRAAPVNDGHDEIGGLEHQQ